MFYLRLLMYRGFHDFVLYLGVPGASIVNDTMISLKQPELCGLLRARLRREHLHTRGDVIALT